MKNDSQLAKEIYNKQFENYTKNQTAYSPVQELKQKIHQELGLLKDKMVLFAGCGDGKECIPAAQAGAHVIGIDISEQCINHAQQNCPEGQFFVMDLANLSFENKCIDIIIALFSVMYVRDLSGLLKEHKRVLKDDGFIILAVPHPIRKMVKYNNMNYFVKGKQFENWKGIERFGYYRLFEDYIASFTEAQLRLVQLTEPKPLKENAQTPDSEINYPHFLTFKLTK